MQRGFSGPIDSYVEHWGEGLGARLTVRDYTSALVPAAHAKIGFARSLRKRLRAGAHAVRTARMCHLPRAPDGRIYIFSDIERLSPVDRERAGVLRDTLSVAPGTRSILNDPRRSLCRYELLRLLHDRGQNAFNIYRVSERVEPKSFPVFIRREDDHRGPMSGLIDSSSALQQALDEMRKRGELREGKVVVEFADTRDADGIVRKYGAFRVGNRIIPRHVFLSRDWMLKEQAMDHQLSSDAVMAEESAYLDANPHESELREIFELADIEYGRIDYGIKGGRIQVWEINTNPTILVRHHLRGARAPIHRRFASAYRSALDALGH